MIRIYHRNYRRAAAALSSAVVLTALTSAASAQVLNVFGGGGTGTTTLSTATSNPITGAVGPGYTGTVSATATVNGTLFETFVDAPQAANSSFSISTGGTLGVLALGNFSATKNFATGLDANSVYHFTLTQTTASTLSALSSLNLVISQNGIVLAGNTTNTGVLGINLVNLFATGNTASFNFTTPASLNATQPLTIAIGGSLPVAALGTTYTLANASLLVGAVPEPSTWAAMGVGMFGLVVMRCRRRLA